MRLGPFLVVGAMIVAFGLAASIILLRLPQSAGTDSPAIQIPQISQQAFAKSTQAPAAPQAAPGPSTPAGDAGLVIKRILPITGPIRYGQWFWDDKGIPDGVLIVTVDLEARVLSVFRDGYEIGASAVLLGTSETPTPLGIFPVKWKDKDHYSSKYDDAPMPYTMNLTADGVAIHGTKVEKGYASHGCIGVPDEFAAKLFALAPVGTRVYITRGKMAKLGDSLT